jgi:CBS domain-containing protein
MQTLTITVFPEDLLSTARRRMQELYVRHLPVVVAGNQIVGIITAHGSPIFFGVSKISTY